MHGVGGLGEQFFAEVVQLVERDHPVVVSGTAVDQDDLLDVAEFAAVLPQLGELCVVLGEDDAAAGVGDDVGDVPGGRGGIHRGGGGAGAHDGQVGEHPFVAGGGSQRHPLLGLHAEDDESGREVAHTVARLGPGDAGPLLRVRRVDVSERFAVG